MESDLSPESGASRAKRKHKASRPLNGEERVNTNGRANLSKFKACASKVFRKGLAVPDLKDSLKLLCLPKSI